MLERRSSEARPASLFNEDWQAALTGRSLPSNDRDGIGSPPANAGQYAVAWYEAGARTRDGIGVGGWRHPPRRTDSRSDQRRAYGDRQYSKRLSKASWSLCVARRTRPRFCAPDQFSRRRAPSRKNLAGWYSSGGR